MLIFMVVGPSLMVLNKEILDVVGFKYPMLVSCLGLVFAAVFTQLLKRLNLLKLQYESTVTFRFWIYRCLPVGICHAATLALGNAQYLYMGMAAIQFLKSFTPIVTAIVTYIMLNRKESPRSCFALVVLCFGTSMAAHGDATISTFGVLLQVGGALAESIRLVMTDFLLSGIKMNVLENMYWLSPAGGIALFTAGMIVEGPTMIRRGDYIKLWLNPFMFTLAASLGVGVQLITTAVIKTTSATSLKVLSQVRNTIPVFYGILIYGEIVTAKQSVGYIISLAAFSYYTYSKSRPVHKQEVCERNRSMLL
uniref:Sugar phosphate transporter domain-containing protein n=1 Tax=Guillardia theta (strain CCMP2712) TaxID=905079 RepID=A0A0C3U364_GUITC